MAKQRRSKTRASSEAPARPKRAAAAKPARPKRTTTAKPARPKRTAPVTKLRADYAKAVKLYEKGLRALQRKQFTSAATAFREVMKQFPSEQELHERASLYLNICSREAGPKKKLPRTLNEKILAATLALNQRDPAEAIALLEKTTSSHRSDDRLHYMLALAYALRQDETTAADHLVKAIALNPDNRIHAGEEPDFDGIRQTPAFINALSSP